MSERTMLDYMRFGRRVEEATRQQRREQMGMYSQDELDSIYGDLYDDQCGWEEHINSQPSSETEWDRADAYERGMHRPDAAWVCTDRDVWHENPFYKGPRMPHPELQIEDIEAWRREEEEREARIEAAREEKREIDAWWAEHPDDDIPF